MKVTQFESGASVHSSKISIQPPYPAKLSTDMVDMEKSMFWQVGRLKENYSEWVFVHSPVKKFRMFESDFVEFFSETKWWVIPLVWFPVLTWLCYSALSSTNDPISPNSFAICFSFGLLLWTFTEYFLHRFLFHAPISKTSTFLITAHFILHGQHHKFPMDKGRLVFPPVAATPFLYIIFNGLKLGMTIPQAKIVTSGLLLAYVVYDLTHFYLHHGSTANHFLSMLRTSHLKHHYKNHTLGNLPIRPRLSFFYFIPPYTLSLSFIHTLYIYMYIYINLLFEHINLFYFTSIL